MKEIEVKFRGDGGDGGEEYDGRERRKKKTKRNIVDRVKDDIREAVRDGIADFVNTVGEKSTKITYKKAPKGCLDTTEFREDIVQTAIGDVSIELADEAIDVERTK